MTWYCYWIPKKQAEWRLALASERDSILASGRAEFITALDLDQDLSAEGAEPDKVKYNGDWYLDFDSETIEETIEKVQEFLSFLKEDYEVDLNQLYLYASGKKGFHIEVPQEMYLSKPATTGYPYLPAIFKEMAYTVYHDTLDLSVYTAKKGRMWRVTNFKRPDTSTYKVQLTAREVLEMTTEYYAKVISVPRPLFAPATPRLNSQLALLWATSKDKVDARMKRNAGKKRDANLLAKFEGKVPPTIEALMKGEGVKEDAGFQQIATQLAIVAHGMNLKCDEFLEKCRGVCENHKGDSSRYRSFAQRQKELARMWHYMDGNPTYDFSSGAIRALVEGSAPDLLAGEATDVSPDGKSDLAITLGMSVDRKGIYKLTEDYKVRVSAVGASNIAYLQDIRSGDIVGYDLDVYLEGAPRGRRRLTLDNFKSKSAFQGFVLKVAGSGCQINDSQVNALADVFRRLAEQGEGGIVYVVNHEGLNIVTLPTGERDIIWVEEGAVLSKLGKSYTYMNAVYGSSDHPFKVDLLSAPRIPRPGTARQEGVEYLTEEQVEELKGYFHHLLHMNSPEVVARILGWVVACFLGPALRLLNSNQFPLLHVYGLASTGKSFTLRTMVGLHGHKRRPILLSAGNTTNAPLTARTTGTTSIPLVVDEYKPTEMSGSQLDCFTHAFRAVWDGTAAMRGRLSRESGETQVVTQAHAQTAPACFIAEQREADTAILQRCVIVPLTPQTTWLYTEHAEALKVENPFGPIGRLLVETLVFNDRVSPEAIAAIATQYSDQLKPLITGQGTDRPRYALAVAATGLHFLRATLTAVFGEEFSPRLTELIETITNPGEGKVGHLVPQIRTAIARVLTEMARLSHFTEASEDRRLVHARDYFVGPDYIEINASACYRKYSMSVRSLNERPVYANADIFIASLDQYQAAQRVAQSELGMRNVYRLDARHIYEVDNVEPFNPGNV